MQHSQVLAYGVAEKLADRLRELARAQDVWLREVRQPKACLTLLRRDGAGVLVLKVGRDLERELALLARVTRLFPETACLVIDDSDNAAVAGLAWELGAACVLSPPQPIEWLPQLVREFLPGKKQETANRDQG